MKVAKVGAKFKRIPLTICATMGRSMFAVPTFDVNSVNVLTNTMTTANISTGGSSFNGTSDWPILMARPETSLPFEMAKPLPNRNTSRHGIFALITSQVIRPSDDPVGRLAAAEFR